MGKCCWGGGGVNELTNSRCIGYHPAPEPVGGEILLGGGVTNSK